ncbi:MAG: hypothetical protein GKS06_02865 [Acidobacteria bacterium]|nr:hypothetical protein [Acidobacteriota bacterium]
MKDIALRALPVLATILAGVALLLWIGPDLVSATQAATEIEPGPVPVPGATSRVGDGALGLEPLEPWIAADPADPSRILVAAMTTGTNGLSSVIYTSPDRGASWHRATLADGTQLFPGGDPAATFGLDGAAFFTTLHNGMTVWRSDDAGRNWLDGVQVPGGSYDRQWIDVDRSGGPDRGRVYSAGKVWITVLERIARDVMAVSYSDDRGASFRSPRLILPPPNEQILHVATDLIVDKNGDVLVSYLTFLLRDEADRPDDGSLAGRYWLIRLTDDGRTHEGLFEIAPRRSYGHASPALSNMGLGGGGLELDPTTGRMYLVWPEAVRDRIQIYAAASADGGRTWAEPQRVNSGGFDANLSNPAIAASDGVVAVTWNDRRADPEGICFQLYGAVSVDGGSTFGPGVPLTTGRACMSGRWANGGDTQGLVGLGDGRFLATALHDTAQGRELWAVEFGATDGVE